MSLVGPGQIVTYLYWIEQVQKLGLGDESTPGQDERRTFKESGEYVLYFWNGIAWIKANRDADLLDGQNGSYYQNASNLNAGTIALARIPNTLTDKDADTLDGQHGSYYKDASNLSAGTVLRARLGALFRNTTTNQEDSPYIQSGEVSIPVGSGTQFVPFDYAYTETPTITVSSSLPSLGKIVSVSTSGFDTQKHSSTPFTLYWEAIGRRV